MPTWYKLLISIYYQTEKIEKDKEHKRLRLAKTECLPFKDKADEDDKM